mgnify:CR=1 FL=1
MLEHEVCGFTREEYEMKYKKMKRIFYFQQLAARWCDPRNPFPGSDTWRQHLERIIKATWRHCSEYFGEEDRSLEEVLQQLNINTREEADEWVAQFQKDCIAFFGYGPITDRIIKEAENRNFDNMAMVLEAVENLELDIIAVSDIELDMKPQAIGANLRQLGLERRRVSGVGRLQYLWIVKNINDYDGITGVKLLSAYQQQFQVDQVSFL